MPEIQVAIVRYKSVLFEFSEDGFGFGQFRFYYTDDKAKTLMLDSEALSRERIKKYLCALVDSAKLTIGD